ncbi:MAG: 3,4-dihydroxy-2-butanone-4-phosphate synthase [Saprospiraceae bacterium]|nr:3,4-dihydroxy-2-butanone-4-phosphate synthase [Saprospiraceae bacterium]
MAAYPKGINRLDMFNSIEEAIHDFKNGKILIVVDDEDRENEGDFICAAERINPQTVNFMATEGRGLICAPISELRADQLDLPLMVAHNTSLHETAFTVSVDLIGHGCSTGISTYDRALTLNALVDDSFYSKDFARPGHIFPLRAKSGGVLQRTGHTEATIDLARMAGMNPGGALVEILNDDGSMARLPQLIEKSKRHGIKIISINDLVQYRLRSERLITIEHQSIQRFGERELEVIQFGQSDSSDKHIAVIHGNIQSDQVIPVRIQYCDSLAELLDVILNKESAMLTKALQSLQQEQSGILVLISNQNKPKDPLNRIIHDRPRIIRPDQDQREIGIGSQILRDLGVHKIKLLTNKPRKNIGVEAYGLEIVEQSPV